MPGHKAAGAVLVQTVKGGAEGQQLPGDGPGQRGPAHGGGAARVQAAGLFGQLRGPVGGGGGQVQADAHHQPLQPPALQVGAGFGEDAAHLFALIIQVVDPLDAQFQPAQLLYRPAHRHGGPDGGCLGAGRRAQQYREVHALPGRAFKYTAQPSTACALVGCEHQRAVGRTVQCQQLGRPVGAFQRVVHLHRGGVGAHGLGTEGVAAQQPIPPAGDGFQCVTLCGEGGGRLVDGGAAHAQLSGQLLAGDIGTPGGTQCLQKGLTGGRRHGGKAPFVLYYNHIVAWNGQNTMFLKKICGLCRECGGCLV